LVIFVSLASLIRGVAGAAGVSFEGYPVYCGGDEGFGADKHCHKYVNKTWIQVSNTDCDVTKENFL
jgi:hypothetical protein